MTPRGGCRHEAALGCLVCAANALSILYADFLFRFRLAFLIRGAEDAEPSEWELFTRRIAWLAFTGLALFFFVMGLASA